LGIFGDLPQQDRRRSQWANFRVVHEGMANEIYRPKQCKKTDIFWQYFGKFSKKERFCKQEAGPLAECIQATIDNFSADRPDRPAAGVLSCWSCWDLAESEIYHAAGNKISGNIPCQRGQGQEKLSLKFTDMLMSGMLPDVAR